MIVKNESKIIRRLLESVINIIDCYCICDTGSTDNTIELIREYFNHVGKPGIIIEEPFKNFEYNRTFALQACDNPEIDADFALLLDADMILNKGSQFELSELKKKLMTGDAFYLFQGNDSFYYKNVRIVKTKQNIKYWGVTHEVISTPDGTRYVSIDKNFLFINDVGDGGSKADKFERDIKLLTDGLKEKPNNDRYTFYLANSLRDSGQTEKAIEYYKKRIEIGGWFEEVWQSYYSIGKCYNYLGEKEKAIAWWLLAYDYYPKRLENIYDIIHHYRCESKHKLVYEFYNIAQRQLETQDKSKLDFLFMHKDVYDYKIDYEYSISGYYYNPDKIDLANLSMRILRNDNIESGILKNVLSNYKFYAPTLKMSSNTETIQMKNIVDSVLVLDDDFKSSTPTFCFLNDNNTTIANTNNIIINQRFVNYEINSNGGYVNKSQIITINKITDLHSRKTTELNYNSGLDCRYVGLEDVRFLHYNGDVHYTANRGLENGEMAVVYGKVKDGNMDAVLIKPDGKKQIEKNWVLFENHKNGCLNIVYKWYPFTTYEIGHNNVLINKTETPTPRFFEHVRGSTNGICVENETWFVCHTVSYEDRRYYYHILVAVDNETGTVSRYTKYFTLHKEKVEYILGFDKTNTGDFIIGYSLMDKTTDFKVIHKNDIQFI